MPSVAATALITSFIMRTAVTEQTLFANMSFIMDEVSNRGFGIDLYSGFVRGCMDAWMHGCMHE
jgi:hypothetical protein